MKASTIYINVQLPLPVSGLFTYMVPVILSPQIAIGKRVIVPFGRQKIYSALVKEILPDHSDPSSLKEIQAVLDENPVVNELQMKLWEWMSEYYMCTTGEVMNVALPPALKLTSETHVMLAGEIDTEAVDLSPQEYAIVEALSKNKEMSIDDIGKLLHRGSVHQILKRAFDKGLIIMTEEIQQRYKPKLESRIRLAENYKSDSEMEKLFATFDADPRKEKQQEALMIFLKFLYEDLNRESIRKSDLFNFEGVSKSSVQTLINNGVLVEFSVRIDRLPEMKGETSAPAQLTETQIQALNEVKASFEKHPVSLLHGVTSSGKTEIYIHLIEEAIKSGKQVLYLLPEIALTTQIITRLQKHFGNKVGVYHSRYTSNERVETWNRVLNFSPENTPPHSQIILGARSAIFLPFRDLGLIIVDEEHDSSYKQNDPSPRYNGRDSAIVLARLHGAKTLLGSATPSLETYYNAKQDKFGLIKMNERHGGIEMPEIVVADMKEARRKKLMKSIFTPVLLESIKDALSKKEQIILFQNRRGFSPFIECRQCNWIPHCRNCSVTLTYHKQSNALKCHYCGYMENLPGSCPSCGDHHLEVKGFGTEKIEEEISVFFPDARIARMDLDSTRSRASFQKIISDFEERQIDILVGTQMVTKGLDFDNVSTVGIINADQLLNFPDFRAFERSFQLMSQVSGRSGRKFKRGKVIIQTAQADHWVIKEVVRHNYDGFFNRDLHERERFGYPPHSRLIEINLRHREVEVVEEAANAFSKMLKEALGKRITGPHLPLVSRIRNQYYRTILVKAERSASSSEIKERIRICRAAFYAKQDFHSVQMLVDVDPD
ncbi:MAG: primosomal protein N' [Bacteroidetes bacterium]|nr:primosomal protein N' [Bacteroidota bacterium]